MTNFDEANNKLNEIKTNIIDIQHRDISSLDKKEAFTNYINSLDDNQFKKIAQDIDITKVNLDKFVDESLTNLYASELKCTQGFTGVNSVIKTFNANSDKSTIIAKAVGQSNQKLGAYLTKVAEQGSEASASITGYGLSLVKMTGKAAVAKAATMTLNTVLMAGVAFLASTGIKKINDWIHAEENAKKKTAELAEKAVENINEYTQEKQALDDLFSKYTDIVTSVDKTIDKKSELTEIQKELTESLGLESYVPTAHR